MSTARSSILMTHDVKTSGDLAISLNSVPIGVESICCNFSSFTMGISVTCSKKSAGFHSPGSNKAASTISCNDFVFNATNRPGSPLAKKSRMRGMRRYGTVKNCRNLSESAGVSTPPNVGSSSFVR